MSSVGRLLGFAVTGSGLKLRPAACRFKARFPQALELGTPPEGVQVTPASGTPVPWLLAEGLTPETASTSTENWCGVIQVSAEAVCGVVGCVCMCGVSAT